MPHPTAPLFKILSRGAWNAAQAANDPLAAIPWAPIDVADGFIHLSAAHQVRETAAKHFADRDDLVLVQILPQHLVSDTLKWEVSRGGDRFPHVHGDIPAAAIGAQAAFATTAGAPFPDHLLPAGPDPGA